MQYNLFKLSDYRYLIAMEENNSQDISRDLKTKGQVFNIIVITVIISNDSFIYLFCLSRDWTLGTPALIPSPEMVI
jgi:hypothetical protein